MDWSASSSGHGKLTRDILTLMSEDGKRLLRSALLIISANGRPDLAIIDADLRHRFLKSEAGILETAIQIVIEAVDRR